MIDSTVSKVAPPPRCLQRRRGRPLASQTAQRDAYILAVAEQLFLERGFDRVSVAMLSRETGIAAKTICARFGDKCGLLDRLVEQRSGDHGLAAALAEAGSDVKAKLHRLAFHACEHLLSTRGSASGRDPCMHQGLWYERLAAALNESRWWLGTMPVRDTGILADLFIGCLMREQVLAASPAPSQCNANAMYRLAADAVVRFFNVATRSGG